MLCDGFESYAAPADLTAAWKTTATAATVTVDTTKAFAGSLGDHPPPRPIAGVAPVGG